MSEVNCAMNYIGNFIAPDPNVVLPNAELSKDDKLIIDSAVSTIENWNTLCEHGVSIALSNNQDIQYLTQANNEFRQKTNSLRNMTGVLRTKLARLSNL